MRTTRTIWISEALVSISLFALIFSQLSTDEAGAFLMTELPLFTVAFLVAMLAGRPGKILALGVGLGFAFAAVLAIGASDSCSDSDILCFGPGAMFAIGLIFAGALYPGWALGTGLGTLARMTSFAERSNR
jgi:hypothetical protein